MYSNIFIEYDARLSIRCNAVTCSTREGWHGKTRHITRKDSQQRQSIKGGASCASLCVKATWIMCFDARHAIPPPPPPVPTPSPGPTRHRRCPRQASLRVLDRRSADALFPAAVSAAIHAELEAVRGRKPRRARCPPDAPLAAPACGALRNMSAGPTTLFYAMPECSNSRCIYVCILGIRVLRT